MSKLGRVALATFALGAGALAYASLIERRQWTLRRYDVPVLPADSEALRLLHISDLHLLPGQRDKQDWVASLDALDPDLVVVTGDNLAHPEAVPAVARALGPLLNRPGAFVFGSNDYYGPVLKNPFTYFSRDLRGHDRPMGEKLPVEALRQLFTAAGWADLNNARAQVVAGGLTVDFVGVDDPHLELDDYPAAPPEGGDVAIGVAHSPEPRVLSAMAGDGYSLLLAGHTHGGQVRVPGFGALVTNCGLDRARARGLHRYDDAWLHVSAGLGTSPYAPVRFACPPEATLLTLVPAA